jgi:beta-N-acetylhexosaminidase
MVDGIDKIIVATTDASFYPGQVKLVIDLLTKLPNVVVVSVRTPYDIHVLPMVSTVLAAYGGNSPTLRAIADVLTGRAKATGILPVALT